MEDSPSRPEKSNRTQGQSVESSKMSMLAMVSPSPHAPFRRDYSWDDARSSDLASSRPRTDPERIALPSIRQAFPELQLRVVPPEIMARTTSSTTSPVAALAGAMTPPEYIHSPNSNKRRRLSVDEDADERRGRIPRLCTGPAGLVPRLGTVSSPTLAPTSAISTVSATESWASSSRTSPFLPAMRSPVIAAPTERGESKPMLPSLPLLSFERESVRGRDDYAPVPSRSVVHPNAPSVEAAAPGYRQPTFTFGYHHPTRAQSLSMSAIHPFDRTPFSGAGYGPYPDYMRMGEFGGMGMSGDNKQRKRRGNLPKETTDKLRAWFVAHLHHPYPTEDEKQELMRQTGLQMNQISNWFINARRRQLPTYLNNARAEADAMASGRSTDGKVLPSLERGDYDDSKRDSPVSEGSRFDEELENLKHHRSGHMKRGSV